MNNFLKYLYRIFIRDKVEKLYLSEGKIYEVLGENFLNGYYFLVLKVKEYCDSKYYLIVENCKTPLFIELKITDKHSEYVKIDKVALKNVLPKNILYTLAKNGLCTTIENTMKEGTNPFTIHRLTMCLYKNILGLTVHHNDKNKYNNAITNLTPLDNFTHQKLDVKPEPAFTQLTQKYNKEFEVKYFKAKRNTLANRGENLLTILQKLHEGHQVKDIVSKQYKKSKIYEVKSHFYHIKEFTIYLKTFNSPTRRELNGKVNTIWKDIYNFEKIYSPDYKDLLRFTEDINKYLTKQTIKLKIKPKGY